MTEENDFLIWIYDCILLRKMNNLFTKLKLFNFNLAVLNLILFAVIDLYTLKKLNLIPNYLKFEKVVQIKAHQLIY